MGQTVDDDSAEDGEEKAEVEEKKKSSKVCVCLVAYTRGESATQCTETLIM